ncbi:ATP-binding cassette domain-containing protein [Acanthopleuribacter pedis]|uniref:ATP-binding cassette domain-containing protein n=1 Tax=Acanthopleuribacter pedis TaxID=442870 RepID=A0A8J7QEU5_9BACT|nr:ATP-binding cassette domain-containing protein [Acanthopleuribacter pedis]MBO1323367.1 ATP-binding cassette domain-containing protein [Acanthopleuribacter pedis]
MASLATSQAARTRVTRTNTDAVVAVDQLVFSYPGQDRNPAAPTLNIPSLTVAAGERLFVYGPSGCGKTPLLGLLAGVLEADHGRVEILGRDLGTMGRAARDAFRAAHIGYIFQMFNLLPYLSVLDNILLPTLVSNHRTAKGAAATKAEAVALADALGLKQLHHQRGSRLSVGQQQRVAAARALIGGPELIIADEPTSALDETNRREFLDLLFQQCATVGSTLIFVSHDRHLAKRFDRAVDLSVLNQAGDP